MDSRERFALWLALTGAGLWLLLWVASAHPHDQRIHLRTTTTGAVIESVTPVDGPTPSPSPQPTAQPTSAAATCPPGTPKLNLGTSLTRVIPPGARLIYCTQVQLAAPPNRIRFEFYERADQDCGNLRMTVRQLAGAKQTKSSGPASNGAVAFVKRIGQGEDPARVANGDYLVELEGFPTRCTSYEIRAGAL